MKKEVLKDLLHDELMNNSQLSRVLGGYDLTTMTCFPDHTKNKPDREDESEDEDSPENP